MSEYLKKVTMGRKTYRKECGIMKTDFTLLPLVASNLECVTMDTETLIDISKNLSKEFDIPFDQAFQCLKMAYKLNSEKELLTELKMINKNLDDISIKISRM